MWIVSCLLNTSLGQPLRILLCGLCHCPAWSNCAFFLFWKCKTTLRWPPNKTCLPRGFYHRVLFMGLLPQNRAHPAYESSIHPSSHPVCTYSHQINLKIILVEIRTVLCAVLSCVSGVALPLGLLVSLNNLLLVEPTKRNVCYSSAMTWVDACCEK
jgi:hypothetical protein